MKYFLLLFVVLFFPIENSIAQCSGLIITGFNSDNPDQIRLVATADLPGSTTFYITDNEWSSSNQRFADLNEDEITWVTPAGGVSAGSVIFFQASGATLGTLTGPSIGTLSGVPALSTGNEEIYILNVVPNATTNGSITTSNICFAVSTGGTGNMPAGSSVSFGVVDNAAYSGSGDITQSSNWTTSSTAINLPVNLESISIKIVGHSTLLSFSTATELNNSHFVIERSADARNFTEIGRVQGAGTTRVPQSYTFTDEKPLSGLNYYRLRQVDFDGAESLSGVVSVVFGKQGSITIAPSPATDRVRIQLDEALRNDGLWQVFDNTGRQVLSGAWEAESADTELDVTTLPEGMYTFRLVVGSQVQVKQFRKL